MIRFNLNFRFSLSCLLVLLITTAPAHAYIVPVYDQPKYTEIIEQLRQAQAAIQSWSKTVGSIREQIAVSGKIASAIRDIKGTISQTVHDVTGEIATAVGVQNLLHPVKQLQEIATASAETWKDAKNLVREVQDLPNEAKNRLKDLGLSTSEMKAFLSTGLYYDTFNELNGAGWKEVCSRPWDALKDGVVGRSIAKSEAYLDANSRSKVWADFTAGKAPEDLVRLSSVIGPDYALYLNGIWADQIEKRDRRRGEFRQTINELEKNLSLDSSSGGTGGSGRKLVVRDEMVAETAAMNLNLKIEASKQEDKLHFQNSFNETEKERLKALRDIESIEDAQNAAKSAAQGQ